MVGKLHLFVAACILAFAFVSEVYGQSACTTAIWGNTTGIPNVFSPIVLPPPSWYWKVTINNPCFNGPNGLLSKVCDNDRAPDAFFENEYVLRVIRTGNVDGDATVDTTSFC